MKRYRRSASVLAALLVGSTLAGFSQAGATPPGSSEREAGRSPVSLFGGSAFPGGYLRYTYSITRQGGVEPSTTTTEITPLSDGTYSVVSTSTETVPLAMVNIGFFGIALPRLGIHVPESTGGTIDLSPLSNIASSTLEPGRNYLLPDGGRFQAGEPGTIAGIEVINGTYTHADYTNVEIDLAFAVDPTLRALLPFPARMVFRYSTSASSAGERSFRSFSGVELTEFIYRPTEDR